MANQRDGGRVVIGVATRKDQSLDDTGVEPVHLPTWIFDPVFEALNSYCDPAIEMDLSRLEDSKQKKVFVVLDVREFADLPIICTKSYVALPSKKVILRKNAFYIRSRQKPASIEVSSQVEMRALVELAIDKQIPRIARLMGLLPRPTPAGEDGDRAKFDAQKNEMLK